MIGGEILYVAQCDKLFDDFMIGCDRTNMGIAHQLPPGNGKCVSKVIADPFLANA